MKRFLEFVSYNFVTIQRFIVIYLDLPGLPGIHARSDFPSIARYFQWFLCTCLLQAHNSFCFAVLTVDCSDLVILGSLNNHCSNTPEI